MYRIHSLLYRDTKIRITFFFSLWYDWFLFCQSLNYLIHMFKYINSIERFCLGVTETASSLLKSLSPFFWVHSGSTFPNLPCSWVWSYDLTLMNAVWVEVYPGVGLAHIQLSHAPPWSITFYQLDGDNDKVKSHMKWFGSPVLLWRGQTLSQPTHPGLFNEQEIKL